MLIRRIRALPPESGGATPAVALIAYARTEDRTQAILAGFQHHVAKPVEPAQLIAMVATLNQRLVLADQASYTCSQKRASMAIGMSHRG